jgi:HK97 family phage major capsid protein
MDLQMLEMKRDRLVFDAAALLKNADKENRDLTTEEKVEYDALLEKQLPQVKSQIATLERDDVMRHGLADPESMGFARITQGIARELGRARGKSFGQQWIDSAAFKFFTDTKSQRPPHWQSPSVELKTTLTEAPTSGGALVAPDYLAHIEPFPLPPIVMSQLFTPGQTGSNQIVFPQETAITNAAAPTAEGALKPESAMTFAQQTAKVEKIPTWLPVSEELLEDAAGIAAFIDAQLRQFVLLALDGQLLTGDGVSPNLMGLLTRTDLTPPHAVGTDSAADAILKQIAAVQLAGGKLVDGIVMNPSDFIGMSIMKATTGEYIGASPFDTPTQPTLWGRPVALTPKMPAGKALVGSFRSGGAQLFTKGGVNVAATNSHQDYFVKNLVAIRAEIRAVLCVFQPLSFGVVTGVPVVP